MSDSAPVLSVAPSVAVNGSEGGTLSPALTVSIAAGIRLAWASVVITDGFTPADQLSADTGWFVLLVLIAICAGMSMWWFRHFEYLPREDAE